MVLERSYIRRKRWEVTLLANTLAAVLGTLPAGRSVEPSSPDDWPAGGTVTGASGTRYRVVSPDAMCSILGG